MQIAEAVRAQRHSTGSLALESRRARIRRGQTLDHHHLVRLGILEPYELDVVLLGHDVRYLHADVVSRYSDLGQMFGRISVAVRLVDFLVELALLRARMCAYTYGIVELEIRMHNRYMYVSSKAR